MSKTRKAAVVGAGLVGVATAIALRRAGFDVEIFERRPAVVPDGFGIAITTNGMLALRELGIADQVSAAGARIDHAEIRDGQNRLLSRIPLRRVALAQGDYSFAFTRPNLHRRLLELLGDVPIHTGANLKSFSERGRGVVAHFEDGRSTEVDLMVGSDGVHSTVRSALHGETRFQNSDYVAWLAISNHMSPKLPQGYGGQWWGRGVRYSLQYAGPQLTYWWGTQTIPNTPAGRQRKLAPVSNYGFDQERFRTLFREWTPELRELIDEYLLHTPAESVIEINPRSHTPSASWSRGHVTLSGDAAHAMFPSLGTGASIGFEDAAVLMHCVMRERDVPTALALYDRMRVDRTNRLLKLAKQLCWLETNPNRAVVALRDAYFRRLPVSVMVNQFLNFTDFQLPREIAAPAVRALGPNERWHWYSSQLSPLNTVCAFRLRRRRALGVGELESALATLQRSHEILSLTVKPSEGKGLEYRRVALPIPHEQVQLAAAETPLVMLNRSANTTFAPDAPLAKLFWAPAPVAADGSEYLLCLVCSHLIADGAALVRLGNLLLQRLADLAADGGAFEALPAALETQLSARFDRRAIRRAVWKQTLRTPGNLLRPGVRLPVEAASHFEDLETRYVQVALDAAQTEELDALCAQRGLGCGDLAVAALARAVCNALGSAAQPARLRIGRSFSFRDAFAPEARDALQSSVAQAAATLEHDSRVSLVDLAEHAKQQYQRLWQDGEVLDGLRVLWDTCPQTLSSARVFAALLQQSGPMHISVTDLSGLPLVAAGDEQTVSEFCLATTLSASGNLVLVIGRSAGRLAFSLGYAHPLVSPERAAQIAVLFERELHGALASAQVRKARVEPQAISRRSGTAEPAERFPRPPL